jgi:NAD(P)-dependent dehydrogenase (short-subunit alcohol dehydrogenase family)
VAVNGFERKVALITGSTRGIGETTARLLAARGARVVVTGRNAERGAAVAESIRDTGAQALFVRTDVGDQDSVAAAVDAAAETFGGLHVLVNNAAPTDVMAGQTRRLTDIAWDEFERVLRVGLYGAVWAARCAIPHMQRAGGGSIVNISSLAAVSGLPGLTAYTCAKGALCALTRQLALDYAPDGIRVNTVIVGLIVNELTGAVMQVPGMDEAVRRMHLTRLGRNEDVARAVAYFASEESGFLTGTELRVDGGASSVGPIPTAMVETGLGADKLPADKLPADTLTAGAGT